jgi:hypothetical protein
VRPLAIGSADPPIHAPAAADGAIFAKQVLERRPQIGSKWADRELHAAVALIMFDSRRYQNMAGAFLALSPIGKYLTSRTRTMRVFATD